MKILLSNNQYMHLFHSANLCTPNVCDNNIYQAQMCASFYYLSGSTDQCTGRWCCGCTPKDELQRMNYLIKEDLQQIIYLPMLQSKPIKSFDKMIAIHNTHQTHSNFCILKFRVLFNFVYQIIYEIKSLRNFILRYIYYNGSFQIYGM